MISEANFVTAAFIDNERTNIEVLLKNDEETKVYPYILEYNPDNPICKELLEICSLDQIHENTWEKKKEEVKLFEDSIIRIAEKKGLLKTAIKTAKERIKESVVSNAIKSASPCNQPSLPLTFFNSIQIHSSWNLSSVLFILFLDLTSTIAVITPSSSSEVR